MSSPGRLNTTWLNGWPKTRSSQGRLKTTWLNRWPKTRSSPGRLKTGRSWSSSWSGNGWPKTRSLQNFTNLYKSSQIVQIFL